MGGLLGSGDPGCRPTVGIPTRRKEAARQHANLPYLKIAKPELRADPSPCRTESRPLASLLRHPRGFQLQRPGAREKPAENAPIQLAHHREERVIGLSIARPRNSWISSPSVSKCCPFRTLLSLTHPASSTA